jgi:hypothetical protein
VTAPQRSGRWRLATAGPFSRRARRRSRDGERERNGATGRRLPAMLIVVVTALVLVGALVTAVVADFDQNAGDQGAAVEAAFADHLTRWREAIARLSDLDARAAQLQADRDIRPATLFSGRSGLDGEAPPPYLVRVAELDEQRRQGAADKAEAEIAAKRLIEQMLREPTRFRRALRRAQTEFIQPLCREVVALHAEFTALRRELPAGPAPGDAGGGASRAAAADEAVQTGERRALAATLARVAEERLAARFSELQRWCGANDAVADLEQVIVRRRYDDLIGSLPTTTTDSIPPAAAATFETQLREMKRLYPHARLTRRAESRLIPLTAKRTVGELEASRRALFLLCIALILLGYSSSLARYIKRRQGEDDEERLQVLRPAPWADPAVAPFDPRNRPAAIR